MKGTLCEPDNKRKFSGHLVIDRTALQRQHQEMVALLTQFIDYLYTPHIRKYDLNCVFPAFTEKCSINITLLSAQYSRVPDIC